MGEGDYPITLSVIMPNDILLNVLTHLCHFVERCAMLRVVMLSVVMLTVMAPFSDVKKIFYFSGDLLFATFRYIAYF